MARKIIYQTIQDRKNESEVLSKGPFKCTSDSAWLGHGYYFWDTFEDLAHWWGESMLKKPYMICKAECNFNRDTFFDLLGETEHIALFRSIAEMLESEGLADENTTVSDVLNYLNHINVFYWKGVRVSGVHSISPKRSPNLTRRMKFLPTEKYFMDYNPPIQLCVYDIEGVGFKDYEIIFPERIVVE